MSNAKSFTLSATSPASASTVVGAASSEDLSGFHSLRIEATLQGATGGTLDVIVDTTYDGGVTWSEYAHFAQVAAGAASATQGVSMSRGNGDGMATVGKDASSVTLAAGDWRDGEWGDSVRIRFVAGAGTTAGAVQTVRFYLSY